MKMRIMVEIIAVLALIALGHYMATKYLGMRPSDKHFGGTGLHSAAQLRLSREIKKLSSGWSITKNEDYIYLDNPFHGASPEIVYDCNTDESSIAVSCGGEEVLVSLEIERWLKMDSWHVKCGEHIVNPPTDLWKEFLHHVAERRRVLGTYRDS